MRLYDYKYSPISDRRKWMETVKIAYFLDIMPLKSSMTTSPNMSFSTSFALFLLPMLSSRPIQAFNSSSFNLMNRLFNMAVRMEDDGNKADIFIDAFTGGGKIGLSVPSIPCNQGFL